MPFISLFILVVWIAAIIDIIVRPDGQAKHLPKIAWLFVAILLPLIGSVLWFAIGRDWSMPSQSRRPMRTSTPQPRAPLSSPYDDWRTTEQKMADLDREIEEDRLRAAIARKRAEKSESGEV